MSKLLDELLFFDSRELCSKYASLVSLCTPALKRLLLLDIQRRCHGVRDELMVRSITLV